MTAQWVRNYEAVRMGDVLRGSGGTTVTVRGFVQLSDDDEYSVVVWDGSRERAITIRQAEEGRF
jgi:hypothetical protein